MVLFLARAKNAGMREELLKASLSPIILSKIIGLWEEKRMKVNTE